MTSIKLGLNTLGLPGYSDSSWNLTGRLGAYGLGLGGYRPGGIGYPGYGFLGPVLDLDIQVMDSVPILMVIEVLLILIIKSMGFIMPGD